MKRKWFRSAHQALITINSRAVEALSCRNLLTEEMDLYEYENFPDYNYTDYENYTHLFEESVFHHKATCSNDIFCVLLLVVSVIIFLLGFFGNALVIWICGFKMKKTVNTTWYLSLAISDFVFCAFLPFSITNMAMEEWIFGQFMCKFISSVMFINMFSSIFLLVIISVDRCISVIFPVWAQNRRNIKKASVVVVLAWILAIGLSIPSMIFREVNTHLGRTICYNNYTWHQNSHKMVAASRFFAGFLIPFIIISFCYIVIILKLRTNRMTKSRKPFKVMTALVVTFFVCWLPYHIFVLLELNHQNIDSNILIIGLKVGTSVAAGNSFLNPVLYVFMGNDFKQKFRSSVFLRIETAMAEDGRTSTSRYFSRSNSVDTRASTHI